MRIPHLLVVVLTLSSSAFLHATDVNSDAYKKDFAQWKNELTEDLKKNWLTAVGLFWLKEGTNRVGSDPRNEVPLPEGKAPRQIGTIDFHAGKAVFHSESSTPVTNDSKPVSTIELKPDVTGKPTTLFVGDIRMLMIQRKDRFAIRVRDPHSQFLSEFKGMDFYPLSQNYVVLADFHPYEQPKKISVPTQIGQDAEMESPGYVEFTLNGTKRQLQILERSKEDMFIVFKDESSGHGTYPAGRFLYTALPKDGKVEIDFNRAYSPPCAWTPYATCPLPPKGNRMTTRIEAGEKFQQHR